MKKSSVKERAVILEWRGRHPVIASIRSHSGHQLKFRCPSCDHLIAHGASCPEFGAGNGHRVAFGHNHGKGCEFDDGYYLREVEHKVYSSRKRKGVGGTRTRH